jgi:hypothetical protein
VRARQDAASGADRAARSCEACSDAAVRCGLLPALPPSLAGARGDWQRQPWPTADRGPAAGATPQQELCSLLLVY